MQRCRVAPDVFEAVTLVHLLPERAIFLLKSAALHRASDQQFNFVEIERLGHKIVSAAFHCFDRHLDGAVRRHHDADGSTRHFQSAINQCHSILATKAQIGKEHIDLLSFKHANRARNVRADIHVVFVFKQTSQAVARMLFIIDHEDGGLWSHNETTSND